MFFAYLAALLAAVSTVLVVLLATRAGDAPRWLFVASGESDLVPEEGGARLHVRGAACTAFTDRPDRLTRTLAPGDLAAVLRHMVREERDPPNASLFVGATPYLCVVRDAAAIHVEGREDIVLALSPLGDAAFPASAASAHASITIDDEDFAVPQGETVDVAASTSGVFEAEGAEASIDLRPYRLTAGPRVIDAFGDGRADDSVRVAEQRVAVLSDGEPVYAASRRRLRLRISALVMESGEIRSVSSWPTIVVDEDAPYDAGWIHFSGSASASVGDVGVLRRLRIRYDGDDWILVHAPLTYADGSVLSAQAEVVEDLGWRQDHSYAGVCSAGGVATPCCEPDYCVVSAGRWETAACFPCA